MAETWASVSAAKQVARVALISSLSSMGRALATKAMLLATNSKDLRMASGRLRSMSMVSGQFSFAMVLGETTRSTIMELWRTLG